ncbi:MAG: RNA polymerase sigma factor [Armatimonadota bacterium]
MTDSDTKTAVTFGISALWSRSVPAEDVLEQLYDQYAHSLFRYALALTSCEDDAEDAVQEVFARLTRERKRLKSVESIKAYLYTSVRNAAYSILRSRRRRDDLEEAVVHEDRIRCQPGHGECEIQAMVLREAFLQIPLEQREVLVLKVFDGMTFAEIAETIGTSINTAASRYRYGIERLRRALEEDHNE